MKTEVPSEKHVFARNSTLKNTKVITEKTPNSLGKNEYTLMSSHFFGINNNQSLADLNYNIKPQQKHIIVLNKTIRKSLL